MFGNLAFKNFLENLSKVGVCTFRTILKIYYNFFFIYLVIKNLIRLITIIKSAKKLRSRLI